MDDNHHKLPLVGLLLQDHTIFFRNFPSSKLNPLKKPGVAEAGRAFYKDQGDPTKARHPQEVRKIEILPKAGTIQRQ
jgi:hypothetical protein